MGFLSLQAGNRGEMHFWFVFSQVNRNNFIFEYQKVLFDEKGKCIPSDIKALLKIHESRFKRLSRITEIEFYYRHRERNDRRKRSYSLTQKVVLEMGKISLAPE